MTSANGEPPNAPLEVGQMLEFQMEDGSTLEYEVRAILEDGETSAAYAILERDADSGDEGEVIVTDLTGNLIEDEELAQDVLDNYLIFSEEAGEGGEKT